MSFQTFHTQLQIIPVFAKGHAPTKPAETLHLQKAWMLFQGTNKAQTHTLLNLSMFLDPVWQYQNRIRDKGKNLQEDQNKSNRVFLFILNSSVSALPEYTFLPLICTASVIKYHFINKKTIKGNKMTNTNVN